MQEIRHFSSKRSELLFRSIALILPLIGAVFLLSQNAFAQNIYVITDGERVLIHSTSTPDPETVLGEAGLSLDDDDTYTTQHNDGVSQITVQRYQTVHINHCGQALTVESSNETVGMLLDRLGISLDEHTTISVPPETTVRDEMVLNITRTVHTTEVYTSTVPYETVRYDDDTLPLGTETIVSEGTDGEVICTANVTYRNGVLVSRDVVKQILSRHASPRMIAVGTAESVQASQTSAAEALPASSVKVGNGTITTPSGEVLSYSHTLTVEATAYTKTDEGCGDWTATGTLARYGAIAVDPRVIPYGTRMYIVSNDGTYVYGIATAEDCGGAINGNRIDLYYDTTAECFQFGRRDCTIYFLV